MIASELFVNLNSPESQERAWNWQIFLNNNGFNAEGIDRIDMSGSAPAIYDKAGNKFAIDFVHDKKNYSKKKASFKSELISKAMGAGKYGFNVLDLSAGLGIDSVFLAQLGYSMQMLERNPLIYLALREAILQKPELDLQIEFSEALAYLQKNEVPVDIIYFDPMFPEKTKSALPRQEMVFFRNLVGADTDSDAVLVSALKYKGAKRVVVKRPLRAPPLGKPHSQIKGKLVRFDIYGVQT